MRRTASATAAWYCSGGTGSGENVTRGTRRLGAGSGISSSRMPRHPRAVVVARRERDAGDPARALADAEHELGHDEHARRLGLVGERERAERDESRARAGRRGRRLSASAASDVHAAAASITRSGPLVSIRRVSPRPTMPSPRRIQSSGCRGSARGIRGASSSTGSVRDDEARPRGRASAEASG
jgi:hypothetical protein